MRKRNKQICIRLTEDEYEKIIKKAEKSKLTMQDYVIKSCFQKDITVIEGLEDIAAMRVNIKRIGNNINQIARMANLCGISQTDIDILLERQSRQQQIVTKLYRSFSLNRRCK